VCFVSSENVRKRGYLDRDLGLMFVLRQLMNTYILLRFRKFIMQGDRTDIQILIVEDEPHSGIYKALLRKNRI